jgi:hypothetical protein
MEPQYPVSFDEFFKELNAQIELLDGIIDKHAAGL